MKSCMGTMKSQVEVDCVVEAVRYDLAQVFYDVDIRISVSRG